MVVIAAPWMFASAAIGYGYLPTQLRGATGSWGLVFATAATVIALGTSSVVQPIAKRLHSLESARGLAVGVFIMAAGIAVAVLAITAQSVWIGLAANMVIGRGLGITLVSGVLEVQRIATPADLADLTGVFYAVAYVGFLVPTVIAAIAAAIPVTTILWAVVALAVLSWLLILNSSTKHCLNRLDAPQHCGSTNSPGGTTRSDHPLLRKFLSAGGHERPAGWKFRLAHRMTCYFGCE